MEASRKVFLKGRALALAQRMALYARDELNMSTLRIRVRLPRGLTPLLPVLSCVSIRVSQTLWHNKAMLVAGKCSSFDFINLRAD